MRLNELYTSPFVVYLREKTESLWNDLNQWICNKLQLFINSIWKLLQRLNIWPSVRRFEIWNNSLE